MQNATLHEKMLVVSDEEERRSESLLRCLRLQYEYSVSQSRRYSMWSCLWIVGVERYELMSFKETIALHSPSPEQRSRGLAQNLAQQASESEPCDEKAEGGLGLVESKVPFNSFSFRAQESFVWRSTTSGKHWNEEQYSPNSAPSLVQCIQPFPWPVSKDDRDPGPPFVSSGFGSISCHLHLNFIITSYRRLTSTAQTLLKPTEIEAIYLHIICGFTMFLSTPSN
jgi:hypothetical protein